MSDARVEPPAPLGYAAKPEVGSIGAAFRNGWFVGCVALLIVLTAGFEFSFRNAVIRKAALPLKKPLEFLDREKLTFRDPAAAKLYAYRMEGQPDQLQPEMVDALGTRDYIGWSMKLWDGSAQKPIDEGGHLFVTYYTGKPDQVPHVPEQCWIGNGAQMAGDRLVKLELTGVPEKDRQVPVKVLTFERGGQAGRHYYVVMYTFRVNDLWRADRDEVRWVLGDFFSKYAYFSKAEVTVPLPPDLSPEAVERAVETGSRLLQTALPVLLKDHWPDWPSD